MSPKQEQMGNNFAIKIFWRLPSTPGKAPNIDDN